MELTVPDLIETLTPAVLMQALGVKDQAISNMKARAAIPPKHWPAIAVLCAENPKLKSITINDIVQLHRAMPLGLHRESALRNHRQKRAGAA